MASLIEEINFREDKQLKKINASRNGSVFEQLSKNQ
jgi:hypothetical protein